MNSSLLELYENIIN